MRKMYSKKQVEEIALSKIEEGKINKTVTLYDGDENPEYPITINFSQELCNDNEQPSLEVRVGDDEAGVGELDLHSGFMINLVVPGSTFYLDDEGSHIEATGTMSIVSSNFTNAFETGEVQYTDDFNIKNSGTTLVNFDDHNSLQASFNGIMLDPDLEGLGHGLLIVRKLPTSDPQVEDALWNDNGTLKISSGQ